MDEKESINQVIEIEMPSPNLVDLSTSPLLAFS